MDYSTKYLTFNILSSGYIKWSYNNNATIHNTIEYRKNGGSWSAITATAAGVQISVVAGDVLEFRGDNNTYSDANARYGIFNGSTAEFNAVGNIMSLINSTNFQNLKTFTGNYNFRYLFGGTKIVSAENLVLPATGLTTGSYRYMFQDSNLLTTAPKLPATTLTSECYMGMFTNCTALKNVICLATSGINTSNSTSSWLSGVSATGTFTKKAGVTWPTGSSGIPTNWIVQDYKTIELSETTIEVGTSSGSTTLTVTSENDWSATTQDSWIALSQTSGNSGETTIGVSWSKNIFDERTATVRFTNTTTLDYVDLEIEQSNGNTLIPYANLFINGNRIN